jgi:hypothetical protein
VLSHTQHRSGGCREAVTVRTTRRCDVSVISELVRDPGDSDQQRKKKAGNFNVKLSTLKPGGLRLLRPAAPNFRAGSSHGLRRTWRGGAPALSKAAGPGPSSRLGTASGIVATASGRVLAAELEIRAKIMPVGPPRRGQRPASGIMMLTVDRGRI